jgi:hypothetical protein
MLLLTMDKKITDHMPDDADFAQHVVREEGPSILMWLMHGAMEGFECLEKNASFFDPGMVAPMVQATKMYRRNDNIFLQWIEEKMRLDPSEDIESKDAFGAFMAWMREQDGRFHMSKEDFRAGLEAATGGEVSRQGERAGRTKVDGCSPD